MHTVRIISFISSFICSSYMSFIYRLRHLLHLQDIRTSLLPADLLPTYQGFTAQLVEQRTGIADVMGSNPVVALKSVLG